MPLVPSATTQAIMVISIVAGSVCALVLAVLAIGYVRHKRRQLVPRRRKPIRHHDRRAPAPPPKRPAPERRVAFLRPVVDPSVLCDAQFRPRKLGALRRDYLPAERSSSAFLDARPVTPILSPDAYELTATPPPQWPLRDDAPLPSRRDGLMGTGARGRSRETLGSSHPHGLQRSTSSTSYVARDAGSRSVFSVDASSDGEGEEGETASQSVTDSPTPLSLPRASHSRDALLGPSAADSPTLPTPLRVPHSRDALLDRSAFVGLGGAQRNTFGQAGGGTWGA